MMHPLRLSFASYAKRIALEHRGKQCAPALPPGPSDLFPPFPCQVDIDGTVKLADFGSAATLTDMSQAKDIKGTPFWMAPEARLVREWWGRGMNAGWRRGYPPSCQSVEGEGRNVPSLPPIFPHLQKAARGDPWRRGGLQGTMRVPSQAVGAVSTMGSNPLPPSLCRSQHFDELRYKHFFISAAVRPKSKEGGCTVNVYHYNVLIQLQKLQPAEPPFFSGCPIPWPLSCFFFPGPRPRVFLLTSHANSPLVEAYLGCASIRLPLGPQGDLSVRPCFGHVQLLFFWGRALSFFLIGVSPPSTSISASLRRTSGPSAAR